MNIIYLEHYAGSPALGMEFRPYFMAKRWAEAGHTVTIVASSYSHLRTQNPDLKGQPYKIELADGIRWFWISGPQYQGNGFGRIQNILSFLRGINQYQKEICSTGKPDVVIASSTYPLDIYPAKKIAKRYGAEIIYEVHDLWPLSPMELGHMSAHHPFIMVMQHAENVCCQSADAIVSLLPCSKAHFVEHGMKPEKFYCIPNGIVKADWEKPLPEHPVYEEKLRRWHEEGWFLIAYTGAHGVANALDSFVEAGEKLKGKKIKLLLIGPGPERERLKAKAAPLENVEMLEPIGRAQIPELLHQMDALYIGLQRQPLFRFGVSPNKLMDYMMAGKPVIFAIEAGNDMVADAQCGISIPPEDSTAIAQAAQKLADMPKEELEVMGKRGHTYILEHHEYDVLAKQFLDVMQNHLKF
ncbi:MAG TPA: glycosyltransferase WbuB [Ruminococcaceae bacterium]|nr:glycosyltransferase WbuB [Oscillospiraceae bacterium]